MMEHTRSSRTERRSPLGPTDEEWEQPARKRQRRSRDDDSAIDVQESEYLTDSHVPPREGEHGLSAEIKDKSITIASTAKLAPQTVAPFLAKHIPVQYAPRGSRPASRGNPGDNVNTKFCYRHRPDVLCRRQADEPSMERLQQGLETLSRDDRQGIVQVWSLFSAAPAKHRELMLQGILAQCCFPQLSFLSANVRDLIRIDFLSALPSEIAFRILSFLDTTSLCKAAQVSRKWRQLADDDVVWHRMCEQHIDRKCTKCGWGLPLLDRKRLRASKRQMELRAASQGRPGNRLLTAPVVEESNQDLPAAEAHQLHSERGSQNPSPPPSSERPDVGRAPSDYLRRTRPWKDVYKDRFKIGTNWKYGRCSVKVLKSHTNGIMALQLFDNILATGSYDSTIKIWDIETGQELRTLTGHTMGIRCLQFDDTKLISGSMDRSLKVWNWRTGECISTYTGHADGVVSLHFDSNLLVSGSVDKTARVWNFEDRSVFTLRGHTDWINSVRIDSASRTVFTASDDCTVKMWDLTTRKCIRTFEGHVGQVQQAVLLSRDFEFEEDNFGDPTSDPGSPGSHHTAVSSAYNVQDSPVMTYCSLASNFADPGDAYASTFADGRTSPPGFMLTSALDSTIRLWEVATGRCIRTFFGHVEGVWGLAADTLRIVSGAEDGMVKVWDPRSGKCERTFTGHRGPVTCVGLTDSRMCSGGEDGEVRVYCFNGQGV